MNDFSFGRKIKFDTSGNPIINANILPSTTLSYDLGSPDKRWRDIYLSGNTIDLDGTKIQKEVGGGIKIADASGNTLDGKFNDLIIDGVINQATRLDVSGSILPTRNMVYDLGAPDKRWNDLYLSGNTIDLSGTLLSRHTDGSLMVHDSFSNMISGRFNHVIADGDVTCDNLTVNGTTTTVNSTTVTVQDPIITLGSDITNTKDKGIEFKYGASKIGFFGYDDSTGNFSFLKDASNNSEVFSGTLGTIEGLTFKSTVASGTAPLTVTSSTLVSNLNADLLDGLDSTKFMRTDISTSSTGSITSSSTITGTRLVSTVPFGTAPLSVTSSTLVTNLNSMLFYGLGSTQFMRSDINTSTTGNMFVSGNVGIGKNTAGTALDISGTTLISGNLGIGVTNPTAKLHVNGDIQAGWLNTTSGDSGNTVPTRFYSSDDNFIRYHIRNTYKMHIGMTGKYDRGRVQDTTDTNYWVGSMGWGTTDWNNVMSWGSGFTDSWGSPGNRPGDTAHHTGIQSLHYTSGSSHNGWQMVNGGGTNRWWLRNVWGTSWGVWNEVIHSNNHGSYSIPLSIPSRGDDIPWTDNIRIWQRVYPNSHSELHVHFGNGGGSTPAAQLRFIYGNGIAFRTARDTNGFEYGWTSISGTVSQRKYKNQIQDLSLGLEELMKIRPVEFTWIQDLCGCKKGEKSFGFIAEEMEELNKMYVQYDIDGNLETIRYSQLTSLLTKAIQELYVKYSTKDLNISGMLKLINGKVSLNMDTFLGLSQGEFEQIYTNIRRSTTNESGFSKVISHLMGPVLSIVCQDENSNDEVFWNIIAERVL